ncbi:MAG: hypothetical protein HKM23_06680 [Nitrosopumilus sp.]|nr:hypothetical protein [Nitrosopumilus sp.]NNL59350.1 hypothetical protein [Nitrosopumilus sp.]
MFDELIAKLILLKRSFAKKYSGSAHIQEILPTSSSNEINIDDNHLQILHDFANKNPIYFNSYDEKIDGVNCTVYEGDINEYWLNSIKHGSSCQPFYPTWIVSAYILTLISQHLGYKELIDIGSGDGRIAFCSSFLGLNSHSFEIDEGLVELQKIISKKTNNFFYPQCKDALELDFSELNFEKPIFFIGGLPQMGGDILATSIIKKIKNNPKISHNIGMVFAGTNSRRQLASNTNNGGWNSLVEKYNLDIFDCVSLPTVWTFDQESETPYIYSKFRQL